MSALLTPSRRGRPARAVRHDPAPRQGSLFAPAPIAPPSPSVPPGPAPAPEPERRPDVSTAVSAPEPRPDTSTTARAHRQGPTLDDLVAGVWEGLLAGAPADCPACGTVMTPRHSAGAGVVGGRCGGCGSTLS